MVASHLEWRMFILIAVGVCSESQVDVSQDMCSKFNIGGPCDLLQRNVFMINSDSQASIGDPYCKLACSQGKSKYFSSVCHCATPDSEFTTSTNYVDSTTTTTQVPTTTPEPVTCYYGFQRPPRLSGITKRLYSGTPVVAECDYPGVVGLFKEENGRMVIACMASLLGEDVLLINDKKCMTAVRQYPLYLLADSYNLSSVTKAISVNKTSAKMLDPSGKLSNLFTVSFSPKIEFNDRCKQPVCLPHAGIRATDIDLNDCRIVGYGGTTDSTSPVSLPQLMEIKVTVNEASITKTNLEVTRLDSKTGMSCAADDSAPVICSHKITGEWMTIGITVTTGYKCSSPTLIKPAVTNLLQESVNKDNYSGLQSFKYVNPNIFAAKN